MFRIFWAEDSAKGVLTNSRRRAVFLLRGVFIRYFIVILTILFLANSWVRAETSASILPSEKDLNQFTNANHALKGPGFNADLQFKAEKAEYLFSLTVGKSKAGNKYKISLNNLCVPGRAVASEKDVFEIGSFKGRKEELLTEFYINRHQVEDAEGKMKYKFFQIVEDRGKSKAVSVSCVALLN